MRQSYLLLAVMLALPSLTAQEPEVYKRDKCKCKPKVITGIGYDMGFTILSPEGKRIMDSFNLGYDKKSYLSVGVRLPLILSFAVGKSYSLGLFSYFSLAQQMEQIEGTITVGSGNTLSGILYERTVATMAHMFYNEFALGQKAALSLGLGLFVSVTFGDKNTVSFSRKDEQHNALAEQQSFSAQFSLNFPLGVLFDLGLQLKITEVLGFGLNTYLQLYFFGHERALDAASWSEGPAYRGTFGTTVSLLLFL